MISRISVEDNSAQVKNATKKVLKICVSRFSMQLRLSMLCMEKVMTCDFLRQCARFVYPGFFVLCFFSLHERQFSVRSGQTRFLLFGNKKSVV